MEKGARLTGSATNAGGGEGSLGLEEGRALRVGVLRGGGGGSGTLGEGLGGSGAASDTGRGVHITSLDNVAGNDACSESESVSVDIDGARRKKRAATRRMIRKNKNTPELTVEALTEVKERAASARETRQVLIEGMAGQTGRVLEAVDKREWASRVVEKVRGRDERVARAGLKVGGGRVV